MWVIDITASSYNSNSYPVEIGLTDGHNEFSTRITPLPNWNEWDSTFKPTTFPRREEFVDTGCSAKVTAKSLNDVLNSKSVYCDDIHWDSLWISRLFDDSNIEMQFKLCDIADLLINEHSLSAYFFAKEEAKPSNKTYPEKPISNARTTRYALEHALDISSGIIHLTIEEPRYDRIVENIHTMELQGWKAVGSTAYQHCMQSDCWVQKMERDSEA